MIPPLVTRALCFIVFPFLGTISTTRADVPLTKNCAAHFSTAVEGAEILGRRDDFIERLSEFDRAARMKTDRTVTTEEFLQFVRSNTADWSEAERAQIEKIVAKMEPKLDGLHLKLPKTISLLKTSGREEGGAFYTRDTAIIFPANGLQEMNEAQLTKTIAHELFHILSRQNPVLREALYKIIGFEKCAEAELPPDLQSRKITNPDAPRNDHLIRLQLDGKNIFAVPILYSKTEKYDPTAGGEFFNYLQFAFLIVDKAGAKLSGTIVPPKKVSGFAEQIGQNTNYVIHPEEILADNFALLVSPEKDVASPKILERMRATLSSADH